MPSFDVVIIVPWILGVIKSFLLCKILTFNQCQPQLEVLGLIEDVGFESLDE